jgi:hypothetical protein
MRLPPSWFFHVPLSCSQLLFRLRSRPSKESTETASLVLASPCALTPSDDGDVEVPTISLSVCFCLSFFSMPVTRVALRVLARLDALHGAAVLEPDAPS